MNLTLCGLNDLLYVEDQLRLASMRGSLTMTFLAFFLILNIQQHQRLISSQFYCDMKPTLRTNPSIKNIYERELSKEIKQTKTEAQKKRNSSLQIRLSSSSSQNHPKMIKKSKKEQILRTNSALQSEPKRHSSLFNLGRSIQNPLHENFNKIVISRKETKAPLTSRNKYRSSSEQKLFQIKDNKASKERRATQEREQTLRQIYHKEVEREKEKQIKVRQSSHDRFSILQAHKETIDMLKNSRLRSARSESKLIKDSYYETEKEHKFLVKKKQIETLQKREEYQYKKVFLAGKVFKTTNDKKKKGISDRNKEIQAGLPKLIGSKIELGSNNLGTNKKITAKGIEQKIAQLGNKNQKISHSLQTFLTLSAPNPESAKQTTAQQCHPAENKNPEVKQTEQYELDKAKQLEAISSNEKEQQQKPIVADHNEPLPQK